MNSPKKAATNSHNNEDGHFSGESPALPNDGYYRSHDKSNGKIDSDFKCMMSDHIADMQDLRDVQLETTLQTKALTTTIEGLTNQIGHGVTLGTQVISLFKQVVYVFLVVVMGMGAMIVWLAHVDVAYDNQGLTIKQPVAANHVPTQDNIQNPTASF